MQCEIAHKILQHDVVLCCTDHCVEPMIRRAIIYGAEAWSLMRKDEELLGRTEMRMVHWILGISLKDKNRNEDIRRLVGVVCITDTVRDVCPRRLRARGA